MLENYHMHFKFIDVESILLNALLYNKIHQGTKLVFMFIKNIMQRYNTITYIDRTLFKLMKRTQKNI